MNGRDERRGMAMGVAQRRTVIAYGRLAMRELRLAGARARVHEVRRTAGDGFHPGWVGCRPVAD